MGHIRDTGDGKKITLLFPTNIVLPINSIQSFSLTHFHRKAILKDREKIYLQPSIQLSNFDAVLCYKFAHSCN